jgi:hypothetical protein
MATTDRTAPPMSAKTPRQLYELLANGNLAERQAASAELSRRRAAQDARRAQ